MARPIGQHDTTGPNRTAWTAVQTAAFAFGLLFLLIGVLGFVPGVTSNYRSLAIASHSEAKLLGIFQVSVLHNAVHIMFGIAGVVFRRTASAARRYLSVGGAFYLLLFLYGLLVSQDTRTNFVPVNTADDILHLLLGILMVLSSLILTRRIVVRHRNANT